MAVIDVTLICFLLFILTRSTSSQTVIYVNPIKGADHHACLTYTPPGSHTPCQSLKYVSQELGRDCSNLTIRLETSEHKLDCLVSFENCSHLSIVGYDTNGGFTEVSCKSCVNRSYSTLENNSLTVDTSWLNSEQCSKNYCNQSDVNVNVSASYGTGLRFTNIDNLCLSNLHLTECGAEIEQKFNATLQLLACSSVVLHSVHFERSLGTAIAFFNTFGNVSIQEVNIFNNKLKPGEKVRGLSYAGGLHIQFTSELFDPLLAATTYTISNCNFYNNSTPYEEFDPRTASSLDNWLGYGLGGGIGLLFMSQSSGISVLIENCNFTNNSAPFGAGLSVFFQGDTVNNRVSIVDSKFCSNIAGISGGGANVGLGKLHNFHDNRTLGVSFERTVFERNTARYGGGVSVHAIHSEFKTKAGQLIHFKNCDWLKNSGMYSPAVDISPFRFDQLNKGLLPIPKFTDCSFTENILKYRTRKGTTFPYSGVFVVSLFTVQFNGTINFKKNKYSAFYMTSGRAIFESGTHVCFHSNVGIKGAAIALYGFSSIVTSNGSLFEFINNIASIVGGGMYYYSNEQRDYFEGRNCFLQYDGPELPVAERNLTFYFSDNKAGFGGTSIYSMSFYACFYRYLNKLRNHKLEEFFNYIGNFTFSDNQKNQSALSTAGMKFSQTASQLSIPGKKLIVPLSIADEFYVAVKSDFSLRIENNPNFYLGNYYTSDNSVRIFGPPGESASLLFSTQSTFRSVYHSINIFLLPCPPGFYFDLKTNSCMCSVDGEHQTYSGIAWCDSSDFQAYIHHGYWAGYIPAISNDSNHLYTALCPLQFCKLNSIPLHHHLLPNTSKGMNDFMCGHVRKGILCGECQDGYSVYYHSSQFKCGPKNYCHLSFIFYILSELIPIAIVFVVIITFDISFTSGNINGFVFFSQVLGTLSIDFTKFGYRSIKAFSILQAGYSIIYDVFNFEFFSIESLSFCMWNGSTVLDALAFKYITLLFSFGLVILLIVILNTERCSRICNKRRKLDYKTSVIHGLSAFLVIVYAQCTRVTFHILTRDILRGKPEVQEIPVTYYGGIPYFGKKHLIYAIPAIICCTTIVALPPIILFLYPLVLHLLEFCGLSDHRLVNRVQNLIAIHRFMPMFDSFQACYKDRMRFFAGLYFLYRVATLSMYTFCQSQKKYFAISEFLLLTFLGIHSLAQPYKSRKHNVIDSLIFLNLAVINGLTIFASSAELEAYDNGSTNQKNVPIIGAIQLILIYLPIFVLCTSIIITKAHSVYVKRCRRVDSCQEIEPVYFRLED